MKTAEQTEFEKTVLDQFMSGKNLFGKDGAFVQKTVKVNHLQRIKVSIAIIIANPFNSLERNEFLSGSKISVFGGSP